MEPQKVGEAFWDLRTMMFSEFYSDIAPVSFSDAC